MATTVASQDVPASSPPELFDWHEFCSKHFPGRSERHNLEAVVAYGKYRKKYGVRGDSSAGDETRTSDRAAIRDWEDEGGA